MPAELEIIMVGLSTFIRDGSRTHVVMPATQGHAGHGIPEHKAMLFWKSVQFDGPAGVDTGSRTLGRRALEIREVGHTGDAPSLPRTLLNLSTLVNDKIARDVVEQGPVAQVLSRLTLELGGKMESGPTAVFTLDFRGAGGDPTKERRMPTLVTWRLPFTAATRLEWRETDLDSQVTTAFAPLVPIVPADPKDSPRITIYHVPANELPGSPPLPAPKAGDRVVHFDAYYELFANPKARPIPVLKRLPRTTAATAGKGGSTGTCMPTAAAME